MLTMPLSTAAVKAADAWPASVPPSSSCCNGESSNPNPSDVETTNAVPRASTLSQTSSKGAADRSKLDHSQLYHSQQLDHAQLDRQSKPSTSSRSKRTTRTTPSFASWTTPSWTSTTSQPQGPRRPLRWEQAPASLPSKWQTLLCNSPDVLRSPAKRSMSSRVVTLCKGTHA